MRRQRVQVAFAFCRCVQMSEARLLVHNHARVGPGDGVGHGTASRCSGRSIKRGISSANNMASGTSLVSVLDSDTHSSLISAFKPVLSVHCIRCHSFAASHNYRQELLSRGKRGLHEQTDLLFFCARQIVFLLNALGTAMEEVVATGAPGGALPRPP